jgi:hypothetical protein
LEISTEQTSPVPVQAAGMGVPKRSCIPIRKSTGSRS